MLQGIEQTDTNGSIGLTIIEFIPSTLYPYSHIFRIANCGFKIPKNSKFEFWNLKSEPRFLGDHGEGETPGPIPNTEVKPFSANGTADESLWESRTMPRAFFLFI